MAPAHTRHPAPSRRPATRLAVALAVALVAVLVVPATSGAQGGVAEELARAYDEAQRIADELAAIETDLALLESEIDRLDVEIAEMRQVLADLEDEVRDIAVQRYVSAGNGPLTFSDDLLEHQRADVMMSAVQRDSRETMAVYEDTARRLDSSSRALADRLGDQEAARGRLVDRLGDLDDELTRLQELQRQYDVEQARIEAERRQAAAAAATSTTAATTTTTTRPAVAPAPATTAAPTTTTTTASTMTTSTTTATPTTTTTAGGPDEVSTPSPPSSSGFVCPVQGVSVFSDTWGAPRSGGRAHKGVDMLAKIGVPVVAPVSGTVTQRWNDTGGHSYHLEGDDGNYYYGTHMSDYGASGRVGAGTVIGYVGDSGNAAGIPHLHFEIHIGGRGNAVNPYPTVKAACG